MELTKNNSCHRQLFYNLERNIVNRLTLSGKSRERITQKKHSTIYYLLMSIFSLFHFVAYIKIVGLI